MLHVQIFYEVEVGDCFSDIAWKFKNSLAELQALNPQFQERNINVLQVGELIRIQQYV